MKIFWILLRTSDQIVNSYGTRKFLQCLSQRHSFTFLYMSRPCLSCLYGEIPHCPIIKEPITIQFNRMSEREAVVQSRITWKKHVTYFRHKMPIMQDQNGKRPFHIFHWQKLEMRYHNIYWRVISINNALMYLLHISVSCKRHCLHWEEMIW